MTPKERVREAIVKAVPEIVELNFGCRLQHEGYPITTINDRRGTGNGDEFKVWGTNGLCYLGHYIENGTVLRNSFSHDEYWKIIGRSITVADLLRTIPWEYPINIARGFTTGGQDILALHNSVNDSRQYWNLTADFDNQSDEFYQWAADILGV